MNNVTLQTLDEEYLRCQTKEFTVCLHCPSCGMVLTHCAERAVLESGFEYIVTCHRCQRQREIEATPLQTRVDNNQPRLFDTSVFKTPKVGEEMQEMPRNPESK